MRIVKAKKKNSRGYVHEFVKLRLGEIESIAGFLAEQLKGTKNEALIKSIALLVDDLDNPLDVDARILTSIRELSEVLGVTLPGEIADPGKGYERYRGLTPEQAHLVRRYKTAVILHRVFVREHGLSLKFPGRPASILDQPPQIDSPALREALEINRRACTSRRQSSRVARRKRYYDAEQMVKPDESMMARIGREAELIKRKENEARLSKQLTEANEKMASVERQHALDTKAKNDEIRQLKAALQAVQLEHQREVTRSPSWAIDELKATIDKKDRENTYLKSRVQELEARQNRIDIKPKSSIESTPEPIIDSSGVDNKTGIDAKTLEIINRVKAKYSEPRTLT